MARYRLTIAYDGAEFHGWQRQYAGPARAPEALASTPAPCADQHGIAPDEAPVHACAPDHDTGQEREELRTVQSVLQRAVREIVNEPAIVTGASRTDAGVHANAQTGAFTVADTGPRPPDERLAQAINARLPGDVLITACARTGDDFDPIRDCAAKGYRYTLHTGRERPLWNRRTVWHVREALDERAMHDAAAILVGTHDFAAFAAVRHGRLSTVRTVLACAASRLDERTVVVDICGNGFLYNMVRIVAGTLVEVGRGARTAGDVRAALDSRDRARAGPTLGPSGLCLEWGWYIGDPCPAGVDPAIIEHAARLKAAARLNEPADHEQAE